jgi:hypothetical protein
MSDELPEGVVMLPDPEPCEHKETMHDSNDILRCADPDCRQRLVDVEEMPEKVEIEVPHGDLPSEWPLFSLNTETNHVTVEWGDDRPEVALITPDSVDQILEHRNRTVDEMAGLEKTVAELEQKNENLQAVLAIVKLGRRPSQKDWESIGLAPMPRHVYLDIMSRKPQS